MFMINEVSCMSTVKIRFTGELVASLSPWNNG